jgi:hypothetical protein
MQYFFSVQVYEYSNHMDVETFMTLKQMLAFREWL